MRIAGLIKNDVVNGYDVCVSLWTQGCPFHCTGCHNPQTWDPNGGQAVDEKELIGEIDKALSKNNVKRNLSILGGEPLCDTNAEFIERLINHVREVYPDIIIFIWTGYKWEEIIDVHKSILDKINVLIDGQYIYEQRDITLPYRGSKNQRVIDVKKTLEANKIILW